MVWRADGPEGGECLKIVWELPIYTRGRGLDLGCGPQKAFPHFIGVDNNKDEQLFGIRAAQAGIIVPSCESLDMFASGSMDFVFSSHLLEHIKDYKAALQEWWRVIRPGGHLVLYLPHKQFYPNIGQPGSNPDHVHDFMPLDIIEAMAEFAYADLRRNDERNEGNEYSFFQVYRKRDGGEKGVTYCLPTKKKSAAVVRYGGIGDMIQAASVLPLLKAEGYHVTFYTTDIGEEVLRHDPHIDEFYVQGRDQVPNGALHHFWANEKKKFDKWVNLCESVEATLLAMPDRMSYQWTKEARHSAFNVNYLERTHDIAGVPHSFAPRFYPTDAERAWARAERQKIGGTLICWSLSGSSVHKAWPWTDQIIARLMLQYPDVRVMLMGDATCEMLETGWQNEPRVLRRSGKYTIRESLSIIETADMIVGPETGLLNAAGTLPMPKLCMLSHSSRENLTKHWRNTTAIVPKTACHPCHKMHYGWDGCWRNAESGAAQCQHDISVDQVWQLLTRYLAKAA